MQLVGGLRKLAAQQGGSNRAAAVYDLFYFFQLFAAWRIQPESGHLLRQAQRTRVPDAQPKATVFRAGKRGRDVAHAVMAGTAPALPHFYAAWPQINPLLH